ncbi:MAG TPA: discoidin domain-containing protein [Pedobacter sp.]|uniref:discoidin domain-containing protein n=1 Tax=Pedobacter sp. TaxID=1411316 RepID=UPI002C5B67B8|nr:discoidin domain-containing protein [Pedobacter sp.]HMI04430.1 discoidin domain-containing protein [Pedobacter sp.]
MKRKGFYLVLIFIAIATTSCKKSSSKPDVTPEPEKPVIVEDINYKTVANTIEIAPELEAAKFVWQNASKKAITIKFKYTADGINKEVIVDNNTDAEGAASVPIFGLTNFTIVVSNTGGKAAATRLVGIQPVLKPEVKLNKVGWTAAASSEINLPDEELNGAENLVDNVTTRSITSPAVPSFWQSDYYLDPVYPYPHWLIIDMKKEARITKIGLNAHTDGNQGFSQFKIEGSIDGIGFTDIAEGEKTFNPRITSEQNFKVAPATPIRYLKITLMIGSPYPCLANFEAYARQ